MEWSVSDDYHVKQGRSTGRVVLDSDNLVVYLKRHWQMPWWSRVMACFFPQGQWTPAMQEWKQLHWAQEQGIPVPEPLAVGQRVGPALDLQSFLAIRELTGMLPLHQAIPLADSILPTPVMIRWKKQLIQQVASMARRLHELHRYHKDLYLCHFYVKTPQTDDQSPGPLSLIDLHRMSYHRLFAWRWKWKDLSQLYFSTWGVKGLDDNDREQLLQDYLQDQQHSLFAHWGMKLIRLKARRYARHNTVDLSSKPVQWEQAA